MKRLLLALTANGMLLASAHAAYLTGFSTWTTIGDTGLVGGVPFATNAFGLGTDDPINLNVTGLDPVTGEDLEAFTGLAVDGFSSAGHDVSEGSALKQSFHLNAGEVFSFSWEYLTNDLEGDFAFLVLDGILMPLADNLAVAPGGTYGFSHSVSGIYASAPAAAAGKVTLALGVADTGDFTVSSALRVPSIESVAVPEMGPGAVGLAVLGLMGLVRRRLGSR